MKKPSAELIPFDLDDKDHIAWMFEVRSHPKVTPYFFAPPLENFDRHVRFLTEVVKTKKRTFFIVLSEGQKCGYCQIIHHQDSYEVGFALHPNWWGYGIGEVSANLLLDHILENLEPKKITLIVRLSNLRAMHLYQKLGFSIVSQDIENDKCLMSLNK